MTHRRSRYEQFWAEHRIARCTRCLDDSRLASTFDRTRVFIPLPGVGSQPKDVGSVDVLFVSMEPSVAGWAPTMAQARARIDDGFRDWGGVALHYAVERELLGGRIRNYLYTNLAKCALPTAVARATAGRRWQNCFPHLQSEIETFNPKWIVAMGGKSYQFLKRSLPEWSGRISKIFHHGWNRMNAIRARLAREGAILLPGVASIRRFAEEFHDRTGRRPVKEAWSLYRLQAALYVTELRELKKTINMGKVC